MAIPIRILNDVIRDTMEERGIAGIMRAVRTYVVELGDTALYADAVLDAALRLPGVPQPGTGLRLDERCLLSRARATPLDNKSGRQVQIDLMYERVPLVTINEDRGTVPIRTMCVPGTRQQILASLKATPPDSNGKQWPGGPLVWGCATTYRCPMRKLVIGKALFGFDNPQNYTAADSVSSVNDRVWMGKPKGYWLYDGLKTQAIEPNDTFTRSLCWYVYATFFTQEVHDWSYWQFLQLPNGHYAKVSPSVISALVTMGYDTVGAPSYRGDNFSITKNKGVTVTYPYPAKDFHDLFGVQ